MSTAASLCSNTLVSTQLVPIAQDFELPIESESRDGDSPDVSKLALGPGGVSPGRGISGAPEGMTPLPDLKDVGKKRAKREAEVSSSCTSSNSSYIAICTV
jgi:hypothetical protein